MLSAEHVRARVQKGELVLIRVTPAQRERALELGEMLLAVTRGQEGITRTEILEAWASVEGAPREKKMLDGLTKLLEDACRFSESDGEQAVALRREVFAHSAALRCESEAMDAFDRRRVLEDVAARQEMTPEALEQALYADLRGAQSFLGVDIGEAAHLVERWEQGQVQAVLLRATRVVAEIRTRSAMELRELFRKLKFHRLIHTFHTLGPGEHRIEIDGPYSLFDSVTKYGLGLAMVLPALEACESLVLTADIRWGKARQPLVFRYAVSPKSARGKKAKGETDPSRTGAEAGTVFTSGAACDTHGFHSAAGAASGGEEHLPQEIVALLRGFRALESDWQVQVASVVLELPGIGSCMPDLVFSHPEVPAPVFLELMGFWSRDAVWRRVELVEQGLPQQILFAVSARLRVSEEVLDAESSAALYVFKGVMSARVVEERLNQLARRSSRSPSARR